MASVCLITALIGSPRRWSAVRNARVCAGSFGAKREAAVSMVAGPIRLAQLYRLGRHAPLVSLAELLRFRRMHSSRV
eukprot:1489160-Pleurochrysis_carterae.AAC.3